MAFMIASGAFAAKGSIPAKYTCDGEDISPPLTWHGAPEKVASFALISDDPDAPMGTWVHWIIFNIPAQKDNLPEGVPATAELPDGSRNGTNSWGRLGYGGPCPPGGTHRYFFKLYALDTYLDLGSGAGKEALLEAMDGRVLAYAEIMAFYTRC